MRYCWLQFGRGGDAAGDDYLIANTDRHKGLQFGRGGDAAGDVLCFADGRRISHVALWAGAGHIVHSALSRGGVVADDLFADTPAMRRLREFLVAVRRVEAANR